MLELRMLLTGGLDLAPRVVERRFEHHQRRARDVINQKLVDGTQKLGGGIRRR